MIGTVRAPCAQRIAARSTQTPAAVAVICGPGRRAVLAKAATIDAPAATSGRGQAARVSGGWACIGPKQPLQPWTHELPELAPNEVDINVTHNGLCHTDIHMRDNDWFISRFPFVAGHEVVGVVRAVGSEVTTLRPGQRVGVGWMSNSCRSCPACLKGEENLCEPGYTGLIVNGGNGGFQAVTRVPADFAFKIPDALASEHAAPLLCAGITVYAPLKKWLTRAGMRVGVVGVGGLGHLAIQFANVMGGVVTALGRSRDKEAEAKSFGAKSYEIFSADTGCPDALKGKFDIILNCSPINLPAGPMLQMLANDGVLVQVGIPGDKAQMQLPLTDLVFGQKKLVGSIVGGRSDMDSMFRLAADKGVKPLVELMPSHKINEAFDKVAAGKGRYRVVLTNDPAADPALVSK